MNLGQLGNRPIYFLRLIFCPSLNLVVISDTSAVALRLTMFNRIRALETLALQDSTREEQLRAFIQKWYKPIEAPYLLLLDTQSSFTYCRQIDLGLPFKDQEVIKKLVSESDVSLSASIIVTRVSSYVVIQGIEIAQLNLLKRIGKEIGVANLQVATLSSFLLHQLPLPVDCDPRLLLVALRPGLIDFIAVDKNRQVLHSSVCDGDLEIGKVASELTDTYLGGDPTEILSFGNKDSHSGRGTGLIAGRRLPAHILTKLLPRFKGQFAGTGFQIRTQPLSTLIHCGRLALLISLGVFGLLLIAVAVTSTLQLSRGDVSESVFHDYARRMELANALDSLRTIEIEFSHSQLSLPATSALISLFCQERFDDLILTEMRMIRQTGKSLAMFASGRSNSDSSVFQLQHYLNENAAPFEFTLRNLTRRSLDEIKTDGNPIMFTLSLVIDEQVLPK